MKTMHKFLAAVVIMAAVLGAQAATVTGYLRDLRVGNVTGSVVFQATSNPQINDGTNLLVGTTTMVTPTNGVFALRLHAGNYTMTAGGYKFGIAVPTNEAVYNVVSLLSSNIVVYSYTNNAAFWGTRVSSTDQTSGFLGAKLVAGAGVTLTTNGTSNQTLTIAAGGGYASLTDVTNATNGTYGALSLMVTNATNGAVGFAVAVSNSLAGQIGAATNVLVGTNALAGIQPAAWILTNLSSGIGTGVTNLGGGPRVDVTSTNSVNVSVSGNSGRILLSARDLLFDGTAAFTNAVTLHQGINGDGSGLTNVTATASLGASASTGVMVVSNSLDVRGALILPFRSGITNHTVLTTNDHTVVVEPTGDLTNVVVELPTNAPTGLRLTVLIKDTDALGLSATVSNAADGGLIKKIASDSATYTISGNFATLGWACVGVTVCKGEGTDWWVVGSVGHLFE